MTKTYEGPMVNPVGGETRQKDASGELEPSERELMMATLDEVSAWVEDPDSRTNLGLPTTLGQLETLRWYLDGIEELAVGRARDEGLSWTKIGALLGTSRQAAWERYA